jgi:hypothetical protein
MPSFPAERALLLTSRAAEVTKFQSFQDEVDRFERDAVATGTFAPGYAEAKWSRDHQQRVIDQLDARLESLDRRRTNLINAQFRHLILKQYPTAQRVLDLATSMVDPDGGAQ